MMNARELLQQAESLLMMNDHVTLEKATATQLHNAISTAAMIALSPTWAACEEARSSKRQAYYMSSEYLMGRMVYNNLYCLGYLDEVREELNLDRIIQDILNSEPKYFENHLNAY